MCVCVCVCVCVGGCVGWVGACVREGGRGADPDSPNRSQDRLQN